MNIHLKKIITTTTGLKQKLNKRGNTPFFKLKPPLYSYLNIRYITITLLYN